MEPKERILVKAHELFNRYGLRSVSMDDIAAQVGMSKKTLYQYYADKEELVSAVFTGVMDENRVQCGCDRDQAENPIHEVFMAFDRVRDMFATMNPSVLFDMEKYHPQTFAKYRAFKDDFLYGMISDNLARGIEQGLYRDDTDIEIITRLRLFTIMLSFNPQAYPGVRNNMVYIEEQLLHHFLRGVATTKGEKLIDRYIKQRTK